MGGTVVDPKPFQSFELVAAGDFDAFKFRKRTTEKVIRALNNEEIHLVGVHGMPGVGKTMLIQALAKQVKKDNLFDEVVVVIVSQFPKLQDVRGKIAGFLDLNLPEGDTNLQKGARLSDRLSNGKKVLIVLDDLWERLELGELGVPLKTSDCKVVFTTRKLDVCHRMETDADVEVKVLSDEDSLALFYTKAAVEGSGISTRIVKAIVNECGGLPLALVTLGLALRKKKNEAIWRDTLAQLKKCIYEGMEPVVSSIKLSFDFLPNEATKFCFLLCCLFPEDYPIKTELLLSYVWGENLFGDLETVSEARDRLLSLLDELSSSNLLVENFTKWVIFNYDCIRKLSMHDVIRDVAIRIASEDDKLGFKVKAGMGLIHWPCVEWTNCKRMSVMGNRLRCNLPSQIKASNLLTLSMRDNRDLEELPSDFFSEIRGLLNLDLSGTGIRSLPSSISCLVNLRTLLVEKCKKLAHVSPIQELETLEILSFRKSSLSLSGWPEGICKLRKLKLLNMSGSGWDLSHHLKVISSMHLLEELLMSDTARVDEDSLYELTESLTHMTSLELDVAYSSKNILLRNLEKLTRFKIYISDKNKCGDRMFGVTAKKFHRSVHLQAQSKSGENWVRALVANTEYLEVDDCEHIESLDELNREGFTVLKVLSIVRCNRMEFLMDVDVERMAPKYAFDSLEGLSVTGMSSFKTFCKGRLPDGFFSKLRVLRIYACEILISLVPADLLVRLQKLEDLRVQSCRALKEVIKFEEGDKDPINSFSNFPPFSNFPNLKSLTLVECPELEYVFPLRVFQDLLQLTDLNVDMCDKMKMIFGNDIGEGSNSVVKDRLVLPRLKSLQLLYLPQLSTLSSPGLMIECPALQGLVVGRCENLKRLPFDTKSVPTLKKLEADEEWFNRLEWDDEVTST